MSPFGNPGDSQALNVLPHGQTYRPLKNLCTFSPALDARCQGAISSFDSPGNVTIYAGNATKLYTITADAVNDKSKGGGDATDPADWWEFVRWITSIGTDQVIATNFTDPVQVSSGAATFADLIASADKPKARHLAVVHSFLVLGNTDTAANQIRWPAINDATYFAVDAYPIGRAIAQGQWRLGAEDRRRRI